MRAFFHGLTEFLKNTMMFLLAFSVGLIGCLLLFILIPLGISLALLIFSPLIVLSMFIGILWGFGKCVYDALDEVGRGIVWNKNKNNKKNDSKEYGNHNGYLKWTDMWE